MKAEQVDGPAGSGMKAKSTTAKSVAANAAASVSASSKKPRGGMYDCDDVTVSYGGKQYSNSGKSRAASVCSKGDVSIAGVTLNGKPVHSGRGVGMADTDQPKPPVMLNVVERAIGGAISMCQSDGWLDMNSNSRSSVRLYISPLVKLDKEKGIALRTSTQKPHMAVIQFELTKDFTDPNVALDYMIDRIQHEFPTLSVQNCHHFLQLHPRYAAMKANLKLLLGNRSAFIAEVRIPVFDDRGKPMSISSQLVHDSEDPLFYGFHVKDLAAGGTNVYFEFKSADKPFIPLVYNDNKSFAAGSGSVFPDEIKFTVTPQRGVFREPTIMEEDDNSTIASESDDDEETETEEEEEDGGAVDFDLSKLSSDMVEQLYVKLGNRVKETKLHDMLSKEDKKPSPKKKKKSNHGGASVAGSRVSKISRGSVDRELKRKTSTSFDNDDVSMAKSTRTVISITPSNVSKFTTTRSKKNK